MLMEYLMRAVGDATGSFAGTVSSYGQRKQVHYQACAWFNTRCNNPFSFDWVCEALDIPDSRKKHFLEVVNGVSWDDIKDRSR